MDKYHSECKSYVALTEECGECHRNAPRPKLGDDPVKFDTPSVFVIWPRVAPDDMSCGEFERREEVAEEPQETVKDGIDLVQSDSDLREEVARLQEELEKRPALAQENDTVLDQDEPAVPDAGVSHDEKWELDGGPR